LDIYRKSFLELATLVPANLIFPSIHIVCKLNLWEEIRWAQLLERHHEERTLLFITRWQKSDLT
jgi:hypothetical protein